MRDRHRGQVAAVSGVVLMLGACGSGDQPSDSGPSSDGNPDMPGGSAGTAEPVMLTGPPVDVSVFGPLETVAEFDGAFEVGVDTTHVYATQWGLGGDDRLVRVPKNGGDVEQLWTSTRAVDELELDAAHVYWSSTDGVRRAAKDAITETEVLLDGDTASFGLSGDGFFLASGTLVGFFSLAAEEPTVFEAVPVGGQLFNGVLGTDGTHGFAAYVDVSNPTSLAPVLQAWSIPDGGRTELMRGFAEVTDLESDGEHVYALGGDVVFRVPVDGGSIEILAELDFDSRWMAIDGENVYVIDRGLVDEDCVIGEGSIWAVRKSGGELTPLAEGLSCPFFAAADASGVYWSVLPVPGAASSETVSGGIQRSPR